MIFCEVKNHLGLILLTRTAALNALNLEMVTAIAEHLHLWQADPDIHAIVISSSASNAFCTGGDLRFLYRTKNHGYAEQMAFFWHEYRLNYAISRLTKPYIALLDGLTMGGGVGIALHGSHKIASTSFNFAMPETAIGLFPDVGASFLLSRHNYWIGLYLSLTGAWLPAADAYQLGLVNWLVDSDCMARIIPALQQLDLSVNAHQKIDSYLTTVSFDAASTLLKPYGLIIKHCFAKHDLLTILDNLKCCDNPWGQATFNLLTKKSPLSLHLTVEVLKKAANSSLAQCLQTDYCLMQHCMRGHDFYEGVRALLIDKDKSPVWQPSALNLITKKMVVDYFEPICGNLSLHPAASFQLIT